MTTPNQMMELPHPQSHCEHFFHYWWRKTCCAFEGCSSSQYRQLYKVGFDQFAQAWKKARNEKNPDDPVSEDIFACNDPATLITHISRFVLETHKSNDDFYPPKILHQLLCGLLQHMRDVNPGFWTSFFFLCVLSITTPQVERTGGNCIPSAKYQV